MKNLVIKIIGLPSILITHDTLVLDRWNWIKKRFQ